MCFALEKTPDDLSFLEEHLTSSSSSFETAVFCVQEYCKTPTESRPGIAIFLDYLCAALAGQDIAGRIGTTAFWALHGADDNGQSPRTTLEECFGEIAKEICEQCGSFANLPAAIGARVAIELIEDAQSPLHRMSRFWDVLAHADTNPR